MNKEEYLKFVENTFADMSALIAAKNADYTGGSSSPFANFELVQHLNVLNAEVGMFVRLSDKYSRLASFFSQGSLAVKQESVEDTLKDLIGYSVLMMAYLESKNK